jgi:putative NIF3 family GTP cyclohydrolase 1 type 2
MEIGVKGELKKPCTIEELEKMFLLPGQKPMFTLPFGKKEIKTVGIISGGASSDVHEAIKEGLDAYISGEVAHEVYHYVKESGINMIAGGHYQTEIVGVNLVREKLEKEKKIETVFIDIPTGL